jgi:hypothetical protein
VTARPVLGWLLLLVLAGGLGACGFVAGDDGPVDPDAAHADDELEQQRAAVRDAAAALLRGAERALAGQVATGTGSWRGCESTFNDQHRNFQYLAEGRVDATGPRPYLETVRAVLEDAGFVVGHESKRPGGRSLTASRDAVSATFSELPEQGDYVLLSVSGPCVDVPEDQRDAWERKRDPSPALL